MNNKVEKGQIAFLGTGLMGAPMVTNLLASGWSVNVWNRTAAKTKPLEELGASAFSTPQEAVDGVPWVITMLADGQTSKNLWDVEKLAQNIQEGATVIEMGSMQPTEAKVIAQVLPEGCNYIDAPVSGGTKGAEAGTLAIMAGGEADAITSANEVFSSLGNAVHVGPIGAGQLAKLCNQAIVAVTIGAVSEAILLMTAGGADPEQLPKALAGGFADSAILQQHGLRMTDRNFTPGGLVSMQLKDLKNLTKIANELNLSLPLASELNERYRYLAESLDAAHLDHAALYLELMARQSKSVQDKLA